MRDWVIERKPDSAEEWTKVFGPAGMTECLKALPGWGRFTYTWDARGRVPVMYRIRKTSTGEIIPGEIIECG